jgi:hypothetical protein
MLGAAEPGAHEAGGRVERLLGPRDRLAELPVAAPLDVAGRVHAVAERRAARRHVHEEVPGDHVVGVALRGARQLGTLAHGRQVAGGALRVDHAEQRGAAIGRGERGDEVTAVRAVCRCGYGGRESEEEDRRERWAESILAAHGSQGCPRRSPADQAIGGR